MTPTSHTIPTSNSKVGQCNICREGQRKLWTIVGIDYCYDCKEWLLKMQSQYKQAAAQRLEETSDVTT